MNYKPEIDGLRAIAVLLVLICHMQLGLPGGYIGVDVFFVISGFLITSNVLYSVENKRFSFWTFYGKRFIRLYPALIVVIVISFLVAFVLVDPVMMKRLARSAKYALLSTSNIFFSEHQGYFAVGADRQPFLHTWSLGVEWQFYILWPMIIWLTAKISRHLLMALLFGIVITSVIASQIMIGVAPSDAYYLMPYRAFELGIGALLVFIYQKDTKPTLSAAITIAGVVIVAICSVIYSAQTPFPGYHALWLCLGSAMCMYGAKGFSTGNILRLSSAVYIGKISYSVYLVHWPLLVFYKYYVFRELFLIEKLGLTVATLVLGALLFHTIEQRISWNTLKNKKTTCLKWLGVVLLLAPLFHTINQNFKGLPWRLGEKQNLYSTDYVEGGAPTNRNIERFGDMEGQKIAYMMGDSFSAHFYVGMKDDLSSKKQYIQMVYDFGCFTAPIYPEFGEASDKRYYCSDVYKKGIAQVNAEPAPLIIAQDWLLYYAWEPFDDRESNRFPDMQAYGAFLNKHLGQIQHDIGDNKLIIIAAPSYYRYQYNAAECLFRPDWLPQVCTKQVYAPYLYKESLAYEINTHLKAYADTHENAYFVDMNPVLCPDGICRVENDVINFNDGRHFSRTGSHLVVDYMMKQLEAIIAKP